MACALRRPTTKISRAVCAIGGSNHGCVGHKHAHRTVVPIFVVAASKKDRSPFLDLHCFSRVLNKKTVSLFDVSPKVTCGPTSRQLLNFFCSSITDYGPPLCFWPSPVLFLAYP